VDVAFHLEQMVSVESSITLGVKGNTWPDANP
jgi:hypothetical protein